MKLYKNKFFDSNKELVKLVESLGVRAIGISGKDGGLLKVKKRFSNGEDIGFVGEITDVNPPFAAAREPVCKSSL